MEKDIKDQSEFISWFEVRRLWIKHWKTPLELYEELARDAPCKNWITKALPSCIEFMVAKCNHIPCFLKS